MVGALFFFIVCAVNYYAVIKLFYLIITSLYRIIFPFRYAVPRNLKELAGADWAVVTGASVGIGRAYALELAKRGFNLVLISHTESKLKKIAAEIGEHYYQVEVRTILFDFTNANHNDYEEKIFAVLRQLHIGLLINNVGMGYKTPARLDMVERGQKHLTDMLVINTLPATILSSFVLKQMVNRNNKGVIINVASSVVYHPVIYLAVYSAAKKYLSWFSSILRKEYAGTSIVIQTVCPMFVDTEMTKEIALESTSVFYMTAENFVSEAINTVGIVSETAGCMAHQIQIELFYNWLPDFVMDHLCAYVVKRIHKRRGMKEIN